MKKLVFGIILLAITLFGCEKRNITELQQKNEVFAMEIQKEFTDICLKMSEDINTYSRDSLEVKLQEVIQKYRRNKKIL